MVRQMSVWCHCFHPVCLSHRPIKLLRSPCGTAHFPSISVTTSSIGPWLTVCLSVCLSVSSRRAPASPSRPSRPASDSAPWQSHTQAYETRDPCETAVPSVLHMWFHSMDTLLRFPFGHMLHQTSSDWFKPQTYSSLLKLVLTGSNSSLILMDGLLVPAGWSERVLMVFVLNSASVVHSSSNSAIFEWTAFQTCSLFGSIYWFHWFLPVVPIYRYQLILEKSSPDVDRAGWFEQTGCPTC